MESTQPPKEEQVFPVACERLTDGLQFLFSDGTTKFIPDFTPRLGHNKRARPEEAKKTA